MRRLLPHSLRTVLTCPPAETVTLLPSLGIQLSSTRRATLPPLPLASSTVLIPLERIAKVVINEGLHGAGGKAYLAVVERGGGRQDKEGKVHVVFPVRPVFLCGPSTFVTDLRAISQSLLPRLEDLLPVWKSAQALLEQ